jgi:hypothetical protein
MTRSFPRRLAVATALLLAGAATSATSAATVEVLVRQKDGPALVGVEVRLEPAPSANGAHRRMRGWIRGVTDSDGRMVFEQVPRGTYTVDVRGLLPPLVEPRENPYASPPVITLREQGDAVQVPVEIWRGTEVSVTIASSAERPPAAVVRFREAQQNIAFEDRVRRGSDVSRFLVPGLWVVSVEAESGFLLTDLVRDRVSLPGHEATLDLLADPRDTFLTFEYAAPSRIEGHLNFVDEQVSVEVVARLTEAGPWLEAARARGGSTFARVLGRGIPGRPGDFEMLLPDGSWAVTVSGARVSSTEPARHELRLGPGATERADFDVWTDDEEAPATLRVVVTSPDGEYLQDAVVEVWQGDTAPPDHEPVGEVITDRWGTRVQGLSPGRYRVAAGHPAFLDGEARVLFDPDEGEGTYVRVKLQRGAVIEARATDHAGKPVEGVTLNLETVEAAEPWLVQNEDLAALRAQRRGTTNTTGDVKLQGIRRGVHRLWAGVDGPRSARHWVHLREGEPSQGEDDDAGEEELRLEVTRHAVHRVAMRVLPGGSLGGAVVCRDDVALPLTASFRVFSPYDPPTVGEAGPEAHDGPVLALDEVLLSGKLRDAFEVGPLREGMYHLALRPTGFEIWTWALGTPDPDRAANLQMTPGATVGLGPVEIDCGPQVGLWPKPAPDGARLDMEKAELAARVRTVPETGRERVDEPEHQLTRDGALLWDLPEGEATLEVTLRHPHLLGDEPLAWSFPMELERGKGVRVHPFPGVIGGAVMVDDTEVAAALWGPEEELEAGTAVQRTLAADARGHAYFAHLRAGTYLAAWCLDRACDALATPWRRVQVVAGEDTLTRPLDGDADDSRRPEAPGG